MIVDLPPVIFVCGDPGTGRSALASAISDAYPATQVHSLRGILFEAINALFFNSDPTLDLARAPDYSLPFVNDTIGSLAKKLEAFMIGHYGRDVLAVIAIGQMDANAEVFERFVFEDCGVDQLRVMRKMIAAVGPQNCLVASTYPAPPTEMGGAIILDLPYNPSLADFQTALEGAKQCPPPNAN